MKHRAAEIAEMVKGVRGVVNRITVTSPPRSDAEIQSDIEFALRSNPVAESYEIDAQVSGVVVTLTGTVDSWREREVAEKAAKGVRGIVALDNAIQVQLNAARTDEEIRRRNGDADGDG